MPGSTSVEADLETSCWTMSQQILPLPSIKEDSREGGMSYTIHRTYTAEPQQLQRHELRARRL